MNDISRVSLGQILRLERRPVEIIPDSEYAEIGIYCFGRGIFHKTPRSGFEVGDKQLYLIKEGDFILQVTFAWEGAVALASVLEEGMYGSTRFPTFRVNENLCFAPYLLNYFRMPEGLEQLVKISPGSAGRNRVLSIKRIPEVLVPLPPIAQQRQIVARIEELAAKIEEARGLRKRAIGELDILYSATSSKFLGSTSSDGHLSDVLCNKPRNGWSARCDNMPQGIAVLSLGAITGFNYKETEFKRTSEPVSKEAHYWLNSGDLLISRSNTPELVGHAAIYNGYPSPCIYPDLMMRLDVDESKANKQFVHHWLASVTVRDFIKSNAKGTSPTMKKISQGIVMNIPFPSNLSLEQQEQSVMYLNRLQTQIEQMKYCREDALKEFDALLPAILDKAFKSEL